MEQLTQMIDLGFTLEVSRKFHDDDRHFINIRLTSPTGNVSLGRGPTIEKALIDAFVHTVSIIENYLIATDRAFGVAERMLHERGIMINGFDDDERERFNQHRPVEMPPNGEQSC